MSRYDVSTPEGLARARRDYVWKDHSFLRFGNRNAHWLDAQMVRSNQPSPRQLADWKAKGIRTVINLRGAKDEANYVLEKDACARLGLTLIDAPLDSRDAPTVDRVERARDLFETIEYPALIHCKSGADRAGLMSVLYRHYRQGEPISVARRELSGRYGHHRIGSTGVLDHFLDRYVADGEPQGVSLIDWMKRPDYDIKALRAQFRSSWMGRFLTDRLLRRE